jgi:hypothetical protein
MATIDKTIYKAISLQDSKNRPLTPLTDTQKTKVHQVITNFIIYMKNKHS